VSAADPPAQPPCRCGSHGERITVYSTPGGLGGGELRGGGSGWLAGWLPNFERLVLGRMDSYDSEQRLILKGFSRSTVLLSLSLSLSSVVVVLVLVFSK